jgi:hypothetical protein
VTDLRDALVSELGKAFEASGHPYSYYNIQTAADTALAVITAWEAKAPAKPKSKKPSA